MHYFGKEQIAVQVDFAENSEAGKWAAACKKMPKHHKHNRGMTQKLAKYFMIMKSHKLPALELQTQMAFLGMTKSL